MNFGNIARIKKSLAGIIANYAYDDDTCHDHKEASEIDRIDHILY